MVLNPLYIGKNFKYWLKTYNKQRFHAKQCVVPPTLIENYSVVSKMDEVSFGQKLRYAIPILKLQQQCVTVIY